MNSFSLMFLGFLYISGTIFSMALEGEQAFVSTDLSSAITATTLFIPLDSASGFASSDDRMFIGDEEIAYDSIQTTDDGNCTGSVNPCLVLTADDRGRNSTEAAAHASGSRVFTQSAGLLNQVVAFKVGNTDSIIGKVSLPFQATWALIKFFAKIIMWDWSFLEGNGIWIKLFLLYPLSMAIVLNLITVLRGPAERLLPI